jgi:diguanylate cyclase (GGDEF)-like protein
MCREHDVNRGLVALMAGLAIVAVVCLAAADSVPARVGYDVAIVATTAVTWRASTRAQNDRRAWRVIAAGMTCWCVGDLAWDGYAYLHITRPSVSLADVCYLVGYPLLAAGILRMVRLRSPGHAREGLLDGVAFAIAAAVATWAFLVVPSTRDASLIDAVVWGAYPLADVLLLAAVAWLVLSPGRRGAPTMLLLGFLASTLLLDLAWAALPLVRPSFDTSLLDAGYPLTYGLLAVAGWLSTSGELTEERPSVHGRMHPGRFVLLGFALATAPIITVGQATSLSVASRLFLLTASTLLAGTVLWRFRIAVREREAVQEQLGYQLAHDHLTGLYNRQAFVRQLEAVIAGTRRSGRVVAVLYVDLDGFKPINDTWGHAAGDAVLVEVAHRLTEVAGLQCVVARMGGDEFAVVSDFASPADAKNLAIRIVRTVADPIAFEGKQGEVSASVGIACGDGTSDAEQLLHDADASMYRTKRTGQRNERAPAPTGMSQPV